MLDSVNRLHFPGFSPSVTPQNSPREACQPQSWRRLHGSATKGAKPSYPCFHLCNGNLKKEIAVCGEKYSKGPCLGPSRGDENSKLYHDENVDPLGHLENFLLPVQDCLFCFLHENIKSSPPIPRRRLNDMQAIVEIFMFAQVLVWRENSIAYQQYF